VIARSLQPGQLAEVIQAWLRWGGVTGWPGSRYNRLMAVSLTSRERSFLKARAHALEPVVRVGHAGVTDKVVAEIDRALTAHELIKVRVDIADRIARAELCEVICTRTDAAEVLRVGKVLGLWRPRPEDAPDGD
jgi:RNA-binding protein